MAKAVCVNKPASSPLHRFQDYGHNRVARGVVEHTKRCSGCGMKVTTTERAAA